MPQITSAHLGPVTVGGQLVCRVGASDTGATPGQLHCTVTWLCPIAGCTGTILCTDLIFENIEGFLQPNTLENRGFYNLTF